MGLHHVVVVQDLPVLVVDELQVDHRRVGKVHAQIPPVLLVLVLDPRGRGGWKIGVVVPGHPDHHVLDALLAVALALVHAAGALVRVEVPPEREVDVVLDEEVLEGVLQLVLMLK